MAYPWHHYREAGITADVNLTRSIKGANQPTAATRICKEGYKECPHPKKRKLHSILLNYHHLSNFEGKLGGQSDSQQIKGAK